jgi:tetratricopeptide (TPR) repeat protein
LALGFMVNMAWRTATVRQGPVDYEAAIAQQPDLALAYFALSGIRIFEGKWGAAERVITDGLQRNPMSSRLLWLRAIIAMHQGDFEAARDRAREVSEVDPAFLEARIVGLHANLALGDDAAYEATLAALLSEQTRDADRVQVALNHARALVGQGMFRQAAALLDRGMVMAREVRAFATAQRMVDHKVPLFVYTGRSSEITGCINATKEHLLEPEVPQSERQFWMVMTQLWTIRVALGEGDVARARAILDRLEAMDVSQYTWNPKDRMLSVVRARLLTRAGNYEAAEVAMGAMGNRCFRRYEIVTVWRASPDTTRMTRAMDALLAAPEDCTQDPELPGMLGFGTYWFMEVSVWRAGLHAEVGELEDAKARLDDVRKLWPRADADLPPMQAMAVLEARYPALR